MVIGNLDVEGMPCLPAKAHSVLIVDAHTVLSRSISLQHLKPVRRGRGKIANLFGAIDLDKAAKGYGGDLLESSDAALQKDRFCFPVAKRADQTFIVLRLTLNVKQEMREAPRDERHCPPLV
jgi:hypothetical protein